MAMVGTAAFKAADAARQNDHFSPQNTNAQEAVKIFYIATDLESKWCPSLPFDSRAPRGRSRVLVRVPLQVVLVHLGGDLGWASKAAG